MESSDSDNEFWQMYSQPVNLNKPSPQNQPKPSPKRRKYHLIQFEKDQLANQLQTTEKAKNEEIKHAKIMSRNQALKECTAIMNQMQERFTNDDYENIKMILSNRDKEIIQLNRMLFEQETIISTMRASIEQDPPTPPPEIVPLSIDERKELQVLRAQIDILKNVCGTYMEEIHTYKRNLATMQSEYDKYKAENSVKLQNLIQQNIQKQKELVEEQDKQKFIYQEFKNTANTELQILHTLNTKHVKTIQSLVTELQSAKLVISNPRLKERLETRARQTERPQTISQSRTSHKQNSTQSPSPRDTGGLEFSHEAPREKSILHYPIHFRQRSLNPRESSRTPTPFKELDSGVF